MRKPCGARTLSAQPICGVVRDSSNACRVETRLDARFAGLLVLMGFSIWVGGEGASSISPLKA